MRKLKRGSLAGIGAALIAGIVIFELEHVEPAPAIVGIVRATEIRIEPEVGSQLGSVTVQKGTRVRAGDILATLSAVELTAQVDQAHAALASTIANRNNVYAGVRREQVDSLRNGISKAEARLAYVQAQLTRTSTLARQNFESQQALDQAEHDAESARTDVAEAQAKYDAAVAGPTQQERAIADAQVQAASAVAAVLERRLDKMVLRAPADGVVSVVAAEVGENVRAGQPVLTIEATGREWISFNVREDDLGDLAVGKNVGMTRSGDQGSFTGLLTELRPLGVFATWQARRVVGDHDRNTLRLRVDPLNGIAELEPGMTIRIER
jgi:HlyD family secretion protein